MSKEPWDISEVIRDKHGINKNIPGRPQQLRRLVYLEWPLTDACANEIPNSLIPEEWKPDCMRLSHSPYSSCILTKHYLWPESGCSRWNDFNRRINYCLIHIDWTMCTWEIILKNDDKWWTNDNWFCIKTTPNKIVHESSIFTANMSKICFRLFELFMIKSVKCWGFFFLQLTVFPCFGV